MVLSTPRRKFLRKKQQLRNLIFGNKNHWLKHATGILHVGAHFGDEASLYDSHGFSVIWVEAMPAAFEKLTITLKPFPNQTAINCLVTDQDGVDYDFWVSSNAGASSSIYAPTGHKEGWPNITFDQKLTLRSKRLDRIVSAENLAERKINAMVIDVQGAELNVLKGSEKLLKHVQFVKAETWDFEAYAGAALEGDVIAFLAKHGFREIRRDSMFIRNTGISADILFERTA
jgi:FkbM family methyltransferase